MSLSGKDLFLSGRDLKALSRIKQDKQLRINSLLKKHSKDIMQKWKEGYTYPQIAQYFHGLSEKIIADYISMYLAKEALKEKETKKDLIPRHQQGFTNFVDEILFQCLDNINKSKRENNDEKLKSVI